MGSTRSKQKVECAVPFVLSLREGKGREGPSGMRQTRAAKHEQHIIWFYSAHPEQCTGAIIPPCGICPWVSDFSGHMYSFFVQPLNINTHLLCARHQGEVGLHFKRSYLWHIILSDDMFGQMAHILMIFISLWITGIPAVAKCRQEYLNRTGWALKMQTTKSKWFSVVYLPTYRWHTTCNFGWSADAYLNLGLDLYSIKIEY